ncbi:hypothetical protein AOLI_G00299780 [Acnodon oligacanthus]
MPQEAPLKAAGPPRHGGRAKAPLPGRERAEQPELSVGTRRAAGASLEINLAQWRLHELPVSLGLLLLWVRNSEGVHVCPALVSSGVLRASGRS